MKTLEGMYDGKGLKIAIVASRFNEFITTKLVGGAEDCLLRHSTDGDDITLAWVPGAFEIPLAAKSWHSPASMTPLSASAQSSVVLRATMTMFALRSPRALHRWGWNPVCRYCSAY